MPDPTTQFFEELGSRGHQPLLKKISGTVRFDLTHGKEIERWFVTVAKGDLSVSHKNVGADCVVSMDRGLFDGIASGKTNATAAMLRGAMDVEGDVRLLVAFQRLLPGSPGSRETPHAGYARRMP